MSSAGIILIGDEILSGKVVDENARFLIEELRELGVGLRRIAVIPDVIDEIAETVREFSERYEHVFTSGGVGPTHDDLTMEGVARAFDTGIVRHPRLEELLRNFYGAALAERNLRMADVPEGVTLIDGESPSWPVIAYRNVYILPGIPQIFRIKFKSIRDRFKSDPYHLRCVFTTDEEGRIAGELDRIVASYAGLQVGSYPRIDSEEYKVKVTLESKDSAQVEAALADLVRALGASVVKTS
jgi:molybdenum cofactor synthesis domain-containing protein